jgi:hypothetical protein
VAIELCSPEEARPWFVASSGFLFVQTLTQQEKKHDAESNSNGKQVEEVKSEVNILAT